MLDWWNPWTWPADTWSAVATTATFITAAAAAIFAGFQVRVARQTREDQAQPFVVVDFEPSVAWNGLMEISIRNVGSTVAKDVKVSFDPPLRSVEHEKHSDWPPFEELSIFKDGIPTLPPGKGHKVFFDRMPDRIPSDLPRSYTATVNFSGPRRKAEPLTYVLDLNVYLGYRFMAEYGIHDSAKALKEIQQLMKRWTARMNGLRVYTIDEDRRLEAEHREFREWRESGEQELAAFEDPASAFEAQIPMEPLPPEEYGGSGSESSGQDGE